MAKQVKSLNINDSVALESDLGPKLNQSAAAPEFSAAVDYPADYHVTFEGNLYRFTSAHPAGAWTGNDVVLDNMTTPDAMLDITSAGKLRVVAADGTILWTETPPPVSSVNGKTGVVVLSPSDVGAASTADATLTAVYADEWIFTATLSDADKAALYAENSAAAENNYALTIADDDLYVGGYLVANVNSDELQKEIERVRSAALRQVWDMGDTVATRISATAHVQVYQLGSQSTKPLATAAQGVKADAALPAANVVAPSTSASDSGKAADAKATGDALAAIAHDWVSGDNYVKYNVVKYYGTYYYASNDIPYSTTPPPDDTTNWELLSDLAAFFAEFLPLTGGTITLPYDDDVKSSLVVKDSAHNPALELTSNNEDDNYELTLGTVDIYATQYTTFRRIDPAHVNLVDGTTLSTTLAKKAPLASPAFTGTPTAPTPTTGDASTKIATTAFVSGVEAGLDARLDAVESKIPPTTPAALAASLGIAVTPTTTMDALRTHFSLPNSATLQDVLAAAGFGDPAFADRVHTHAVSDVTGLSDAMKYAIVSPVTTTSGTTVSATLQDRAVNNITLASNVTQLNLTMPAQVSGVARDLFIRLVVTGSEAPEVSFTGNITFDVDDDEWANVEPGVNIIMLTETNQ